jgi:hypothetical protein
LALLMAASTMVAVACTDSATTEPQAIRQATPEENHLLGGLIGGLVGNDGLIGRLVNALIPPVHRNVPLPQDITWSFWAGPNGTSSNNAAVGLSIVIPRGAMTSTQLITVTALAGSPVAYKFEPHGLQFERPVLLTQNLRGTTVGGLLSLPILSGAYFATDRLELDENGLAAVTEILPALTSLLTKTVSFPIEHFSGYIVASGRSGRGGEEETDGR